MSEQWEYPPDNIRHSTTIKNFAELDRHTGHRIIVTREVWVDIEDTALVERFVHLICTTCNETLLSYKED